MLYNNKNYIKNICLQLRNNIDDIIIDLINLNIIIENLVIINFKNKKLLNNDYFFNFIQNIVDLSLYTHNNHIYYKQLTEHFNNLLENLLIINENSISYNSIFELMIDCNNLYDKQIYNLLKSIDSLNSITSEPIYKIHFSHNISEGEFQLLNNVINLFTILKNTSNCTVIVLLDEPDVAMHPDWSSKFINCLIAMTNDLGNNRIFQFFITTHSPFILSDIPKEYITTIDIKTDKKTGNHLRKVEKAKKSFASNYYDLLDDSFFLDSTLGHYARKKIEEILEIINKTMTSKPIKQESNQTFINIMSAYDYNFLDIIKMTKTNNHSDISDTIVQKYSNLFSNKKIDDIITIVENNKEKSVQEILNILKRDNIYLSIDYDYIYKKLYKIIEIIDEPFIRESLKQELDKNYKNIADTNYIDYIDSKIALLKQELHNLIKLREENKGELNDKT